MPNKKVLATKKVKVKSNGVAAETKIFIDDREIDNITALDFHIDVNNTIGSLKIETTMGEFEFESIMNQIAKEDE